MRRPSQRNIAQRAGVSQTAVSLVLNGKTDSISTTTQERIRRAMTELSYVPDPAARSLRGGRNDLIGVHTYEPVFPVGPDDHFHDFLVGIEQRAVELARDLVLFASTQRPDGRRSIYGGGTNRLRLADGTVVFGLERDDDELRRLTAERYPFVVLGRRDSLPEVASVGVDYAPAVTTSLTRLVEAGHRRIGYLRGRQDQTPQRDRRDAARTAAAGLGITLTWYEREDTTAETGPRYWVAEGLTAVVVEATEDAPYVERLAREAGVEIPTDLSAVCLDAVPAASEAAHWSQLSIPKRAVGARALTVLTEILDGRLPADHRELHPCDDDIGPATVAAPRTA